MEESKDKKKKYKVEAGRIGGLATSAAKARSSRANGRKGGRPRKPDSELKYPRHWRGGRSAWLGRTTDEEQ